MNNQNMADEAPAKKIKLEINDSDGSSNSTSNEQRKRKIAKANGEVVNYLEVYQRKMVANQQDEGNVTKYLLEKATLDQINEQCFGLLCDLLDIVDLSILSKTNVRILQKPTVAVHPIYDEMVLNSKQFQAQCKLIQNSNHMVTAEASAALVDK